MNSNELAIKRLDDKFLGFQKNVNSLSLPKVGWVRTIRKSLGMTIKQLAQRLGVDPSRVVKIESSEVEGAMTLKTMNNVAKALDSKFVYAFVPNTSFEDVVRNKAEKLAAEYVNRVAHSMALEAQSVDKKLLEKQIQRVTEEILAKSWKHLWE